MLPNSSDYDIFLYIYLIKNIELISCQGCCCIPCYENKMYKIKNSKIYFCKNCISKWVCNYNNPNTGKILEKEDIEINYEINNFIEIYLKHKKLDINNINVNISIKNNISIK